MYLNPPSSTVPSKRNAILLPWQSAARLHRLDWAWARSRIPPPPPRWRGSRKQNIGIFIPNLRTELFRPLWTRQRSTEEMRPNLIAMEIKISNQVFIPIFLRLPGKDGNPAGIPGTGRCMPRPSALDTL